MRLAFERNSCRVYERDGDRRAERTRRSRLLRLFRFVPLSLGRKLSSVDARTRGETRIFLVRSAIDRFARFANRSHARKDDCRFQRESARRSCAQLRTPGFRRGQARIETVYGGGGGGSSSRKVQVVVETVETATASDDHGDGGGDGGSSLLGWKINVTSRKQKVHTVSEKRREDNHARGE